MIAGSASSLAIQKAFPQILQAHLTWWLYLGRPNVVIDFKWFPRHKRRPVPRCIQRVVHGCVLGPPAATDMLVRPRRWLQSVWHRSLILSRLLTLAAHLVETDSFPIDRWLGWRLISSTESIWRECFLPECIDEALLLLVEVPVKRWVYVHYFQII